MFKTNNYKARNFLKEQFQKLTKEQMQESLEDFKEKHNRGFHKTLQIEVLTELLT